MTQKNNIAMLLLTTLIGLVAGFSGHFLAKTYLISSSYGLPFFGELNLTDGRPTGPDLVIRSADTVIVEQNKAVYDVVGSVEEIFSGVYRRIEVEDADERDGVPDKIDYYNINDRLSEALAITSDGWMLADNKILSEEKPEDLVVIDYEKKIHDISKIVFDEANDLIFMKLAGADNLSVAKIDEAGPDSGQMIVGVNAGGDVWVDSVIGLSGVDGVKSSDSLNSTVKVNESDFTEDIKVYFNLTSGVAVVKNINNENIPAYRLKLSVNRLLNEKELKDTVLGVNYLDLSDLAPVYQGQTNGALIIEDQDGVAVKEGTPAALAGLRAGDIITEIDNMKISKQNDLAWRVQGYLPGESISVLYLRDEKENRVEINL